MDAVKDHSVKLIFFTREQLQGQRLARVVAGHLLCGAEEMHVRKSPDEPGKHIVSITFVSLVEPKRGEEFGQIHVEEVSLNQATVDKIEIASARTQRGRYCIMAGCPFVLPVEF